MRRLATRCVWSAAAILAVNAPAIAGPPFLTDDPVPVPYRHNEFYIFGTLDHADGSSAIAGPAIEYNRGVAPLAADQPGYTVLNAGGYLNFTPGFSLLFSAGRSIAGARHTVAYLGLYWTWGPRG
ncbi:MAG: hypothetical protein ACREP0_10970 [Rhodanobacteraceae bacterium]